VTHPPLTPATGWCLGTDPADHPGDETAKQGGITGHRQESATTDYVKDIT